MNLRFSRTILETLFLLFASIWLLGLFSLVGLILYQDYTIVYSISVAICLIVFPWLTMWFIDVRQNKRLAASFKYSKSLFIASIIIVSLLNYLVNRLDLVAFTSIVIKYSIVALGEELLFRYYIQNQLEKQFSILGATILQAVLFAFILHSGFPILLNLMIRVPSGIILTYLFKKSNNLPLVIAIHFLYNAIIHIMWL